VEAQESVFNRLAIRQSAWRWNLNRALRKATCYDCGVSGILADYNTASLGERAMLVVTYRNSTSGRESAWDLGQQANDLTVYLYQSGNELFDDFWDIGTPCDGLAAALATLATSSVDALLVTSLDRLGCNMADVRTAVSALHHIGVALLTVNEGIIDLDKLLQPGARRIVPTTTGQAQMAV
jgi:Resolvase, N terminal domain